MIRVAKVILESNTVKTVFCEGEECIFGLLNLRLYANIMSERGKKE